MRKLGKLVIFIGVFGMAYGGWKFFSGSSPSQTIEGASEGQFTTQHQEKSKGSLLSMGSRESSGERTLEDIRKNENLAEVRSPAYEKESFTDEEFVKASASYVRKYRLDEFEDRTKEFFPTNGLGQKLNLELVLKNQPVVEGEPWPNPKGFALQESIQEAIAQHPEMAVVTYSKALASMPKEMKGEREHIIRQISKIGSSHAQAEGDVKRALIAEMKRNGDPAQSVSVLTQLLSVKPDSAWVREIEEAYETAFPGSRISEFVAIHE